MTLGALLAEKRRERGLSLADLASKTYVSRGWINNVEAGRRWPSREWVDQTEIVLNAGGFSFRRGTRPIGSRVVTPSFANCSRRRSARSELLLAAQPDVVGLDQIGESTAKLAVAYLGGDQWSMHRRPPGLTWDPSEGSDRRWSGRGPSLADTPASVRALAPGQTGWCTHSLTSSRARRPTVRPDRHRLAVAGEPLAGFDPYRALDPGEPDLLDTPIVEHPWSAQSASNRSPPNTTVTSSDGHADGVT